MGYVKIHDQLFTSSIIEEDVVVRWVWIAMLLSCDRNGNVYGTLPALARKANVGVNQFEAAMEILMSPDKNSTSPEEDGRRIVETGPNLYHCVNYLHYRGMKDPVEEREKTRERVAKHRKKKAGNAGNKNVTKCNDIAEAEAEAEAENTPPKPPKGGKRFVPPTPAEVQSYLDEKDERRFTGEEFVDFYESKGWMVGKNKMKAWKAAARTWINSKNKKAQPTPVEPGGTDYNKVLKRGKKNV